MGQGYEDHLVKEADIPEAKGLYTNDIQRLYKVASAIVHISQQDLDLSTYIGQIASLKEEFLTVMPLTPDILGSSSVPSLDDVFARLLRISSTQTLPSDSISDSSVLVSQTTSRGGRSGTEVEANVLIAPIAINLATLAIVAISYMEPPRTAHMAQSSDSRCLSLRAPPHLRLLLPLLPSLDLFSSITTTSALPTVTLANGSQTVAKGIGLALPLPSLPLTSVLYTPECPFNLISISKITRTLNCSITFSDKFVTLQDRSTGKTIGIGRESQGLYHLTSDSSPAVCISTDAPLLIHNRLGHPSLSKFQKMVLVFPLCRRFRKFYAEIQTQFNISIRVLRSDNAREYFSAPFTSFMSHHGILHQSSCAHTPQQNGVAERKNRHLVETARTILLHSNVPFRFWGDAVLTACYLINRMPSSVLHDQIPHSLLFPDQPLYFLPPRVFGCTCFVHILTPGQDKLSAKAMKCLFLGYSRLQKGYRCYSLETHRYFISADVTFFEDSPFFSTTSESLPVSEVLPIPIVSPPDAVPLDHFRFIIVALVSLLLSLLLRHLLTHFLSLRLLLPRLCLLLMTYPLLRKGTRSTRNPHPIYNFLSYHRLSSPYSAFVSAISSVSLPKSTHEALSHPGWRQAMVDEMAALHSNGTWDLVVLPSGKSTVGCRWVYAVKVGPDGQIASVRLLLSMAAMCSWPLYQLDIKNVFLHGDAEEVYMEQPPGFVAQGESGLVCRLRRSLYGLKQSPRAWFSRFSSVVQEFGMLRSTADHSVFYHHNSLGQCIYLVVYVDDIVITGSDQDGIQKLKQHLFTHFQTKDLGKLKYFLGIEIAQSSSVWSFPKGRQGEHLGDPGRYRRLVGKLNYLTITRPDISFPVSVVSQFLQSPCDSHWDVVIRILRYIKSTPGQGVLYENRGHTQVVGYTDADWAGSPTDRCSISGGFHSLTQVISVGWDCFSMAAVEMMAIPFMGLGGNAKNRVL
ncbi:Retrovirus-related Pol polyprotein from transposon RE2 [Vitis vinifera]|uniref:Retrovirus-related Pol polyprotein from transposon RE2 n=1 Tax=Vitis vinifera TaxID=29760 RepID=A0A438IL04_VITVI|nr:Retrovirus-related Pol polyprotein from transposon RE2 [Vitis vinifera]